MSNIVKAITAGAMCGTLACTALYGIAASIGAFTAWDLEMYDPYLWGEEIRMGFALITTWAFASVAGVMFIIVKD